MSLPLTVRAQLKDWQDAIDALPSYTAKVSTASTQFDSRNRPTNQTFRQVRTALEKMCSGARRCCYCEDSCADEVEHIKPKNLYPEATFVWSNYLYACGPCNGPKKNLFKVILRNGSFFDVTRKKNAPIVPPRRGTPALINPRKEDPLQFMELDLLGTFIFLPTKPKGSKDYDRAVYTIETLRLNIRDILLEARREAYGSYKARLAEYITLRNNGEPPARVQLLITALKNMQHPTVWREMKRSANLIREIDTLFRQAPEALRW